MNGFRGEYGGLFPFKTFLGRAKCPESFLKKLGRFISYLKIAQLAYKN